MLSTVGGNVLSYRVTMLGTQQLYPSIMSLT